MDSNSILNEGFLNDNYQKLPGSYLFSDISKRIQAYTQQNPDKQLIRLGIGDVTRPLCPAVIEAMHAAVAEMGDLPTFRGYGPEQGYDFLREAIAINDYAARGVDIGLGEIFVSDGSKCDCANISELFSQSALVAVCDPVYPVYVDSNAMAGRAGEYSSASGRWDGLVYMPCTAENDFLPEIPRHNSFGKNPDLIYLCFPNNPTGSAISAEELAKWVDYANETGSVILYDSAYEAYITEDLPHSIYEIPGAKTCAIEFRSFSKTAGFTGTRCAYTVIPSQLIRSGVSLNSMWNRRQTTKFNGTPYVTQRGAAAIYTPQGRAQVTASIAYYMNNAKIIRESLAEIGFEVHGGVNAPYIWLKTPDDMKSWEFFDYLIGKVQIVGTPGSGFGPCGEGYFRLTAFGSLENTLAAMDRIKKNF
ncbi:MAG: LL-diaminopimelate aminotransferase [Saccharofermentanales bacterium]